MTHIYNKMITISSVDRMTISHYEFINCRVNSHSGNMSLSGIEPRDLENMSLTSWFTKTSYRSINLWWCQIAVFLTKLFYDLIFKNGIHIFNQYHANLFRFKNDIHTSDYVLTISLLHSQFYISAYRTLEITRRIRQSKTLIIKTFLSAQRLEEFTKEEENKLMIKHISSNLLYLYFLSVSNASLIKWCKL